MALTMAVIGACAPCLRHIRCPISMIAPTFGIRTASERQEALQTLLSFIFRGAACLLPCWHNVRRPSRTLFRKRHNTTHNIYGHLVIWSFGQNAKKKVCQNLYSIIYNIYYTIAQITHFHFLKMTKWPNDHIFTSHDLMPVNPSPVSISSMTGWGNGVLLCKSLCGRLLRGCVASVFCSCSLSSPAVPPPACFFTALFTAPVSALFLRRKGSSSHNFLHSLLAFFEKMLTMLLDKASEK